MVRAFNQTKRLLELVNYEVPVLGMPARCCRSSSGGSFIITDETV
jgi:hypothetical protein